MSELLGTARFRSEYVRMPELPRSAKEGGNGKMLETLIVLLVIAWLICGLLTDLWLRVNSPWLWRWRDWLIVLGGPVAAAIGITYAVVKAWREAGRIMEEEKRAREDQP
jgi:hypothetical protein